MTARHTQEHGGAWQFVETADGRQRWQFKVVETRHGHGVRKLYHSGIGPRSDLRYSRLICRDRTEAAAIRCARQQAAGLRRWLDDQ